MKTIFTIVAILALMAAPTGLLAQQDSVLAVPATTKEYPLQPYHRNVIKFNPTPMLLLGNVNNITLSYERLFGRQISASVQVGYLLFPRLFDDTIAGLIAIYDRSRFGVNLAADFRYYPGIRNRRPAPDGLYLGAYISYYGFQFSNHFDILYATADQNGHLEGRLNIMNIGLELGYQFVFWKRFTVDLLMFGPSVSRYGRDLTISGELDPDEIGNINQEVADKIFARFPALKTIFSGEDLKINGARTNLGIGFRYSIQLGFHF